MRGVNTMHVLIALALGALLMHLYRTKKIPMTQGKGNKP